MKARFSKLTDEDEKGALAKQNNVESPRHGDVEDVTEIDFQQRDARISGDAEMGVGHGEAALLSAQQFQAYIKKRRSFIKGAMLVFTTCVVPLIIVIIVMSSLLTDLQQDSSGATADSESSEAYWQTFQVTSESLHGAVATDTPACSDIGLSILAKGGNAVDAAIAATFCLGVLSPASSGIGGGCYILVHNASSGANIFIDAREVAPSAAAPDMFARDPLAAQDGPRSAAVLGEVKGLEHAFRHYGSGNVAWADLVMPAAALAREWTVSPTVAALLYKIEPQLRSGRFPPLGKLFLKDGGAHLKEAGDKVRQPQLADTLQHIAQHGAAYLHDTMAEALAQELRALGGVLSADDLRAYRPDVRPALETDLGGHRFVSVGGSSSGGAVLGGILKFLAALPVPPAAAGGQYAHYLAEAMKHAFAMRLSLGDPDYVNTTAVVGALLSGDYMAALARRSFEAATPLGLREYGGAFNLDHAQAVPEDRGTSHVSVVDRHGHAVALTSTVNTYFGSKVVSASTGLLWNNQMDDFSTPNASNFFGLAPSPFNFPAPGKKPLSSMAPCLLLDRQGRATVVGGGSGGPRIITATAQMLANHLWFGMDLLAAVRRPRIHAQLLPDAVDVEAQRLVSGVVLGGEEDVLTVLRSRGHHNVTFVDGGFGVTQFVAVDYTVPGRVRVQAVSDPRKNGRPAALA